MNDIMNGIQTYRNPKLVHILDKLNLIENYGTGIPRTMYAYSTSKKKPEFFATENFFTVKLPNMNYNSDQINDQINGQNQSIDQINDQNQSIDQINDQINGQNQSIDQINDQINNRIKGNISDLGLEILKLIKEFPGIKVPDLTIKLQNKGLIVNTDKIRNEIKRHLFKYIEYKGSNKTGGYYLKY